MLPLTTLTTEFTAPLWRFVRSMALESQTDTCTRALLAPCSVKGTRRSLIAIQMRLGGCRAEQALCFVLTSAVLYAMVCALQLTYVHAT